MKKPFLVCFAVLLFFAAHSLQAQESFKKVQFAFSGSDIPQFLVLDGEYHEFHSFSQDFPLLPGIHELSFETWNGKWETHSLEVLDMEDLPQVFFFHDIHVLGGVIVDEQGKRLSGVTLEVSVMEVVMEGTIFLGIETVVFRGVSGPTGSFSLDPTRSVFRNPPRIARITVKRGEEVLATSFHRFDLSRPKPLEGLDKIVVGANRVSSLCESDWMAYNNVQQLPESPGAERITLTVVVQTVDSYAECVNRSMDLEPIDQTVEEEILFPAIKALPESEDRSPIPYQVLTSPPGVEIRINGLYVGNTREYFLPPLQLYLMPGEEYVIQFTRPDHEEETLYLYVSGRETLSEPRILFRLMKPTQTNTP
ncbi:MAG TPA: hypothetical protein PLF96_09830 [Thermotogota bacterium]|nr:hypothetical protein [Thermotogota bacterium]